MSAIGNEVPAPGDGQGGEGNVSPTQDWERQYNELRPEYTRATQELSTYRDRVSEYEQLHEALRDPDPETQQAALAALGFELDTGSPDPDPDEFADPLEKDLQEMRAIVDELRSARELETASKETEQLEQLRDEFIGDSIGFLEEGLKPTYGNDFKFSEREEEALGNLAIQMADEKGVPDVEGAYNLLYGEEGVLETNRSRWIASKTGAFTPPPGTTVPAEQRPRTARERAAYIDQRVQALESMQ
jgi:hypothetical protein